MIESMICPSSLSTDNSTVLATFNRGDSFKMAYHFYPLTERSVPVVSLDSFNFTADFWIHGYESDVLHFSKSSISSQTCFVDERSSLIKFLFQNITLNPGKLYAKYVFTFQDRQMPNGWSTEVVEGYTGVIIK